MLYKMFNICCLSLQKVTLNELAANYYVAFEIILLLRGCTNTIVVT